MKKNFLKDAFDRIQKQPKCFTDSSCHTGSPVTDRNIEICKYSIFCLFNEFLSSCMAL